MRHPAWTVDTHTIDRNTVAATEVFDHDSVGTDMQHRMLSRHQSVRQCKVA